MTLELAEVLLQSNKNQNDEVVTAMPPPPRTLTLEKEGTVPISM
jgi:hypothetical protein